MPFGKILRASHTTRDPNDDDAAANTTVLDLSCEPNARPPPLPDLSRYSNLRSLDLSGQRIIALGQISQGVRGLKCLRDVWLSRNFLRTLDGISAFESKPVSSPHL
jgi:Leucine-rich repeat (LRR) protein